MSKYSNLIFVIPFFKINAGAMLLYSKSFWLNKLINLSINYCSLHFAGYKFPNLILEQYNYGS